MLSDFTNEIFEQKSKEKYEKLKKSFLNTIEHIRWNNEKASQEIINYFLEEIYAFLVMHQRQIFAHGTGQ